MSTVTSNVVTMKDVLDPPDSVLTGVATNVAEVQSKLGWLDSVVRDQRGRLLIATKSSTRFAAAVAAFLEDPHGVGLNELRDEYARFMGVHSGNFYSMPPED